MRRGQGQLARYQGLRTYYSLIDSPAESAVTLPNILEPHRARTVRRMMGQKVVLCVQDGSDLNYNTLDGCEDLGVIGSNQTGAKSRGLHLHCTLALKFQRAAPGRAARRLHGAAGEVQDRGAHDRAALHAIPIEEKKSFIWTRHHRTLVELASQMPHTRLVDVWESRGRRPISSSCSMSNADTRVWSC